MRVALAASVIRVLSADGMRTVGAGFLVAPGLAVTCAHVVEAAKSGPGGTVNIADYRGEQHTPAQVSQEGWRPTATDDLAFLTFAPGFADLVPVELSTAQGRMGRSFTALGFPAEEQAPYLADRPQGEINGTILSGKAGRADLLLFDGREVRQGMSGSALLDLAAGQVVGMICEFNEVEDVRRGYAVCADTLAKWCPKPLKLGAYNPPAIQQAAQAVEPEMVTIAAGEFWMGSASVDKEAFDGEEPYHQVYLDAYGLGRYPVTVSEFSRFVSATGHHTQAEDQKDAYTWRTPRGKNSDVSGKEKHPVTQVGWEDVMAYCRWLSKVLGRSYGLPSEAQWEKGARGGDGRIYPWGNAAPDKNCGNIERWYEDTTPVGRFSLVGDSPYGCADMAGNVWEWCLDWYDGKYYARSPDRNPAGPMTGEYRVVRGGSWYNNRRNARCASRYSLLPASSYNNLGFRLVSPGAP